MADLREIQTFAFLDLETSCLPEYNFGKTSITELSLIACSKESIENLSGSGKIPRCINKLTLCFNPAARIDPTSTKLSGLDNDMLEKHNKFDKNAGQMIQSFIKHLRQPVCLVAHNGNKFDFPILKKRLQDVRVDIPKDILFIDSLPACRTIDSITRAGRLELTAETTNSLEATTHEVTNPIKSEDQVDWQKINETTPRRSIQQKLSLKRAFREANDEIIPPKMMFRSRRELFPTRSPQTTPTKYEEYKLGTIYERVVGEKVTGEHHAEGDVMSLLKIAVAYGQEFIKYAQCNATPFYEIPALGSNNNR